MVHDTPLYQSFRIQLRVIGALLMREILTRYGRHNIGFGWVFFEPMMFTLGVTALWSMVKVTHGSNLPITAFTITGYSSVLLWRNCATRCAAAVLPNLPLLYHRNVRVIDLFFARLLLEISGATLSFLFLSFLFTLFGLMDPPDNISMVIGGWLFLVGVGAGLGLIIGSLSELSETAERIWHTVAYLLFPLSGAAFMVEWMPPVARPYLLLLPMVHGVEVLRGGYFGSRVTPHFNVEYMIFSDLLLLIVGLVLARYVGKRVTPE